MNSIGPIDSVGQTQSTVYSPKYRPDIDGLRAVAILLVVGFHAFPSLIRGGFIGVDVFFVISGFLISSVIVKNLERDNFRFVDFYNHRIRRIFPALVVVLLSCVVAGWYLLSELEYARLGKHITGGAGFVSNLVLWSESGYFDSSADSKPLLHLWSLGIEEQFYIFWPLTVWFAWKRKWNFVAVTLTILLVSFALNIAFLQMYPVANFYSPVTRVWELLMGAALVRVVDQRGFPSQSAKYIESALSILGIAAIAVAAAALNKDSPFPGWWALLPTIGAALIIYAGPPSLINKWFLSNPLMVWVGLISYPLYLWHWPILSFLRITGALKSANQIGIVAVFASFALAWVTYRMIEKPLRFRRNEISARPATARFKMLDAKAGGLLAAMILICVGGGVVFLTDGNVFRGTTKIAALPPLPDQSVFKELKIFEHWMRPDTSCKRNLNWSELLPEEVCVANSPTPKVLFIGDSHAMALYTSVFAKHTNIPSALVASPGCQIYPNLVFKPLGKEWGQNCTQVAIKGLDLAKRLSSIDTVVISTIRKENAVDKLTQFYSGNTQLTEHDAFVSGTEYLIGSMLALGKRVIYVVDVPYFPNTPENCQTRFLLTKSDDCVLDKAALDGAFKKYFETLNGIKKKFPKLEIFDAATVVCNDTICSQHDDAQYFYIDKDHLSVYGSQKVLQKISARFPLN